MTEKGLLFRCMCCGLPLCEKKEDERTDGVHPHCVKIYYPEQYEEMEKSDEGIRIDKFKNT